MILASLGIHGDQRKVLMQAPKNGFFEVVDRTYGEPISAEAFVNVLSACGIDKATRRPIEVPEARFGRLDGELLPPAHLG